MWKLLWNVNPSDLHEVLTFLVISYRRLFLSLMFLFLNTNWEIWPNHQFLTVTGECVEVKNFNLRNSFFFHWEMFCSSMCCCFVFSKIVKSITLADARTTLRCENEHLIPDTKTNWAIAVCLHLMWVPETRKIQIKFTSTRLAINTNYHRERLMFVTLKAFSHWWTGPVSSVG